jgi:hypothetical protein
MQEIEKEEVEKDKHNKNTILRIINLLTKKKINGVLFKKRYSEVKKIKTL